MKIYIKPLANYRKLLSLPPNCDQIDVEVSPETLVSDLVAHYGFPPVPESVVLINGLTPLEGAVVTEGDVICVFPAMAGG